MDSSRASSLQDADMREKLYEAGTESRAQNDVPRLEMGNTSERPPSQSDEETKDMFLVTWDENDPKNPRNWSAWYKVYQTFLLGMLALAPSLGSSIISPAEDIISKEFGVSKEITVFCVALYVLGFALGPSLWAPIAEQWGRRVSMLPPLFVLGLFSIGTATSNSAAAIFVTRFFGGVFGSAPISNVSAALGDLYRPEARGTAVAFYAVAVCGGPTLGPLIGAALTVNPSLGWRWTEYILAIWVFFMFAVCVFALPESFAPVLLARKAREMRKTTGDDRYYHPHESSKVTVSNIFTKHISRPLRMLLTEPIVMSIALYASFVYGCLYLCLELLPIVYLEERQWGLVVSTLPFLAMFIGVCSALVINLANQPRYHRAVEANGGKAVPEARLQPMIIGGFMFVAGIFWFGWTADPSIPWIVPTIAVAFIGGGFNVIFQQCINFLVDSYGLYAASATSANTFLRSLLACGLPLAAGPLFHNLGVGPGSSLLGAIACLALPVPFLFMKYARALRQRSKFAPDEE